MNTSTETLRAFFPIGSTVSTKLLHTSRSGMMRSIAVLAVRDGEIFDVSSLVARATGSALHAATGGVKVTGCGMDMGFHLVYSLARALYTDQLTLDRLAQLRAKKATGEPFEPYERKALATLEADDRPVFYCTGTRYATNEGDPEGPLNACTSNDHSNERTPDYHPTRVHSDAGYALSRRWV